MGAARAAGRGEIDVGAANDGVGRVGDREGVVAARRVIFVVGHIVEFILHPLRESGDLVLAEPLAAPAQVECVGERGAIAVGHAALEAGAGLALDVEFSRKRIRREGVCDQLSGRRRPERAGGQVGAGEFAVGVAPEAE